MLARGWFGTLYLPPAALLTRFSFHYKGLLFFTPASGEGVMMFGCEEGDFFNMSRRKGDGRNAWPTML